MDSKKFFLYGSMMRGFTLIELLVVVAIIGLLASVVLAALTTARDKGNDGAVKTDLSNARSQAELFYATNTAAINTYTNICTNGTVGGVKGIGAMVYAASNAAALSGTYAINGTGTVGTATCNSSATAWAAEAPLKSAGANQMWCVDSLGKSKQENNVTIGATTVCP